MSDCLVPYPYRPCIRNGGAVLAGASIRLGVGWIVARVFRHPCIGELEWRRNRVKYLACIGVSTEYHWKYLAFSLGEVLDESVVGCAEVVVSGGGIVGLIDGKCFEQPLVENAGV